MFYFCTYFDINYVSRAHAMYNSLSRHCSEFHLYMLCLDHESAQRMNSLTLQHATVITLETFERGDERLVATKNGRTKLEYYYTCGPSLPLYVLNNYSEVGLITYLDADLFFYSDPKPLLDEIDGYSIGITRHNFPSSRRTDFKNGIYNVGWLSFRRDEDGIACLKWWRERCIEWCHEYHENGKYADQLYLEQWPSLFNSLKVLEHRGANVAPWNISDYKTYDHGGNIFVSGYPLVFYHFHGFRQVSRILYNTNLGLTFKPPSNLLKKRLFTPYINELNACSISSCATCTIRVKRLRPKWIQAIRTIGRTFIGIIFRQYIFVVKGKVL